MTAVGVLISDWSSDVWSSDLRCGDDRHQFRFIVSAEDGDQYPDLKPFVRRLMTQMEEDLGTKLDWVAVDHLNTGHPHSHVMLRGRADSGENIFIARDNRPPGIRERRSEERRVGKEGGI